MGEVVINKEDLIHNINEIKSRVEDSKYTIIAVVKGNGYGLDIVQYTKFLESNGISFFAVASVEEALVKGEKVQLIGFGTFETRERKARQGRNPRKPDETIEIPASKAPVFKAGKALKDSVNK